MPSRVTKFLGRRLNFVRSGEVTFDLTMRDSDGMEKLRAVATEREIRMTLAPGERWPDICKRGQAVDLEMMLGELYRVRGRVRFRRLNVCVIVGALERAS